MVAAQKRVIVPALVGAVMVVGRMMIVLMGMGKLGHVPGFLPQIRNLCRSLQFCSESL